MNNTSKCWLGVSCVENTTPLNTGHTPMGWGALDIRRTQEQTESKSRKEQVSCQNLPVPTKKFVPLLQPHFVCVIDFTYAALCDTILPKAKQLCWSREDCLILYNIESLVVKYLLLVVAYPQPKLIESGSTLIMRMHSSDLFRINQRKGWPQREQFTNTVSDAGKPFYQEKKENTHFNSVFCLRVLVVLVPLMTWGWEGVVEVGILPQNLRKCLVSPLARQHWVCVLHVAEKSSQLFSHYITLRHGGILPSVKNFSAGLRVTTFYFAR